MNRVKINRGIMVINYLKDDFDVHADHEFRRERK